MKRFITRINGTADAALKEKQDKVSDAALSNGWQDMALYVYNNQNEQPDAQYSRFDGIIAGISWGCIVAVQLPTGNGHIWEQRLISHIKAYGGKVIIYLHQTSYESGNGKDSVGDTVFTCNHQEALIVDSFETIKYLEENGLDFHISVFVRERNNELLDDNYYISKVLNLAFETALIGNNGLYQLTNMDSFREIRGCEFTYCIARTSYQGKHVVSYQWGGNADGIIVKADGRVVWETNDLRCHYVLIGTENIGERYMVSAYVYTLKGRMIVASTDEFSITEPVYHSEEPKISLIIPAYNAEKFIVRTIDTALGQSQEDIEIVIVDDESSDSTPDILEWYAEQYESVHVLRQQNGGQASARNTGIDFAHGKYIAFMDHDDMLPVNALKSLYDVVALVGADIIVGGSETILKNYRTVTNLYNYRENELINIETFLGQSAPVVIWNKLYRSELCKKHKFGPRYHEDAAWTPLILSYANTVAFTNELVYEWDRTNESLSGEYEKMWSREKYYDLYCEAVEYALDNCNPARLDLVKGVILRSEMLITFPKLKDKVMELVKTYNTQ